MNYQFPAYHFAGTYNCGAYGAEQYNSSQVCGAATGGSLANTGLPLDLIGGIAILLITAAAAVLMWRGKKARKQSGPPSGPSGS